MGCSGNLGFSAAVLDDVGRKGGRLVVHDELVVVHAWTNLESNKTQSPPISCPENYSFGGFPPYITLLGAGAPQVDEIERRNS